MTDSRLILVSREPPWLDSLDLDSVEEFGRKFSSYKVRFGEKAESIKAHVDLEVLLDLFCVWRSRSAKEP